MNNDSTPEDEWMPAETRAREGRVRELLREYHTGSHGYFRRAIEVRAAEMGAPVKVLVTHVSLHHVHVVYEDDMRASQERLEDIVSEVARRWIPMEFRVTVDSVSNMSRKSLSLIDANQKLHMENAALKQRLGSLQSLVGAILLSTGLMIAFVVWRGVVAQ